MSLVHSFAAILFKRYKATSNNTCTCSCHYSTERWARVTMFYPLL